MTTAVHVIRPGLQTTVQDEGRWGFQHVGVSVAGPMDPFAHRMANALVGNHRSVALLEIAILGPELEFERESTVAITGAQFDLTVDGAPVPSGEAFIVPARGRLQFGSRRSGARAYLSVAGGFDIPAVLGSRATDVLNHLGGWAGRAVRAGDRLPLVNGLPRLGRSQVRRRRLERSPATEPVRVLPGPDRQRFDASACDALASASYVVSVDSNRMGFRLGGPAVAVVPGPPMLSDATPIGSLQVPPSGQPILLMADRQTTGGYPRVATVISADIGVAGQAAPGDTLRFALCTAAAARAALLAQEREILAVERACS